MDESGREFLEGERMSNLWPGYKLLLFFFPPPSLSLSLSTSLALSFPILWRNAAARFTVWEEVKKLKLRDREQSYVIWQLGMMVE